jgi:hypothetical protein
MPGGLGRRPRRAAPALKLIIYAPVPAEAPD